MLIYAYILITKTKAHKAHLTSALLCVSCYMYKKLSW